MAEQALSYKDYLASLPLERREAIESVWQTVRENIPKGFTEEISDKFLTFKADDDWFIALANQKNYISLYLCSIYIFLELKAKLDSSGKKLKCGKSCINFKNAEEFPLETIAEIVSAHDAGSYRKQVREIRESSRVERKSGKAKAQRQA
ncbi:MAG: DUF1801 domain-containing protein [Acidobacteria bacterium]|nr:DUF1801 domain-containing protein [Acidobacteriota bacterium]